MFGMSVVKKRFEQFGVCIIGKATVIVVDSNDPVRMEEAAHELHNMLENQDLRDVSILILANKQDLPNALTASDICDKLGIQSTRYPWHIQTSSATTGV